MRRGVSILILAIAVLLSLSATGTPAPAGSGQPQFPPPGPKRKVVWAMPVAPPNVIHTAVALAKEFGFMDKFNIDVEIKNFEGSTRALTAAITGDVQLGYIDCLVAYGNGVPVVSFYGPTPKVGVVMVARDPIKDIKDLKGKKLGMSSAPGGFIDRMNRAVLEAAGLRPQDVTIVQTTTAGRVPALVSGQTDTAVFHYEQASKVLRELKGVRVIYDLYKALPNYQYHVVCGMRQFVQANRELVSDFVAATILAIRYAYTHRAETIRAAAKITGADERDVSYAYARIVTGCVWARNLGLDMNRIRWTIDFEHQGGVLRNTYNPEEAFDMGIANEALRKAGGAVPVPPGCF
jgi:NitT/TauT family transport system substrate-binding protein